MSGKAWNVFSIPPGKPISITLSWLENVKLTLLLLLLNCLLKPWNRRNRLNEGSYHGSWAWPLWYWCSFHIRNATVPCWMSFAYWLSLWHCYPQTRYGAFPPKVYSEPPSPSAPQAPLDSTCSLGPRFLRKCIALYFWDLPILSFVSVICSFLSLRRVPLYAYVTVCLSSYLFFMNSSKI